MADSNSVSSNLATLGASGWQIRQPNLTNPSFVAPVLGSPGLWWDFKTDFGKNQLADRSSLLTLANTIGTPLTLAGTQPYVTFNAAGALHSNVALMTALQKAIFNLATLTTEEMFVMWAILTHGTTAGSATGTIFFWGRSNNSGGGNGWGLQSYGGAGVLKLRVYHTPQGGSNDQTNAPAGLQLVGDTADNTKTAFAMTVTRNIATSDMGNMGRGAGLFRAELAMNGLVKEGQFGQVNSHCLDFARIPSGTAPANYCDTGLTIGARPTTAATTVSDPLPANWGLDTIGFQRRKRQHGLAQKIVRQLAEQYRTAPTVVIQPPAVAN